VHLIAMPHERMFLPSTLVLVVLPLQLREALTCFGSAQVFHWHMEHEWLPQRGSPRADAASGANEAAKCILLYHRIRGALCSLSQTLVVCFFPLLLPVRNLPVRVISLCSA